MLQNKGAEPTARKRAWVDAAALGSTASRGSREALAAVAPPRTLGFRRPGGRGAPAGQSAAQLPSCRKWELSAGDPEMGLTDGDVMQQAERCLAKRGGHGTLLC